MHHITAILRTIQQFNSTQLNLQGKYIYIITSIFSYFFGAFYGTLVCTLHASLLI